MKGKWIKDYCPYCKDQGFDSVIGNVAPGEVVFGFYHLQSGSPEIITFKTATNGKVTMMRDTNYRVLATKISAGSEVSAPYNLRKYKDLFYLAAESGEEYDIVIVGKVGY
jgi:hypothetical protein